MGIDVPEAGTFFKYNHYQKLALPQKYELALLKYALLRKYRIKYAQLQNYL